MATRGSHGGSRKRGDDGQHARRRQIAAWHVEAGRPAPSPKRQSDAFRHAARWLRGVRLNQRTHGRRVAVIEQAINLRLVTLDDVATLFPTQLPS